MSKMSVRFLLEKVLDRINELTRDIQVAARGPNLAQESLTLSPRCIDKRLRKKIFEIKKIIFVNGSEFARSKAADISNL